MKLFQSLAAITMFAAAAVQGCIRLHVINTNNFLTGDTMRVQLWDNNDFYCEVNQGKRGAGGDTRWIMDCPNGDYHIELWNDGKKGHITHRVSDTDTWRADLDLKDTKFSQSCILSTDNGCRGWATQIESCLNDNFGNCGEFECGLCDGRACPH